MMHNGVDLSRFENFNSDDSGSILKIFREYQGLFDGPPRRYPEAMRIAGTRFVTEHEENICNCAQKLRIREITLRKWVDTHGQLPLRRLTVAPLNSSEDIGLGLQKIANNLAGGNEGSIIVELPNGCKITAMGAKADALIAKLLQ
jgi:hypothetical protein